MRVAVIGAGSWGTALARLFALKGIDTVLYGRKEVLNSINTQHRNLSCFPTVLLPDHLSYTTSLKDALKDTDTIVISVPSSAYELLAKDINDNLDHKVHVVSTAKGFEERTFNRLSTVLRNGISPEVRGEIITLVGPSYASEVIRDQVTAITAACVDEEEAKYLQQLLSSPTFRIYTNTDEIGCECAAAMKNVIAIGAGMLQGLGQGENAKAALVTRAIHESLRFGIAMGGKAETYLGLSGIGDLMLTCNSKKSRNFSLGYMIGEANCAKAILQNNQTTVEGVRASKNIAGLSRKMGIELPIVTAIEGVLFHDEKPSDMIARLMVRSLKPENE